MAAATAPAQIHSARTLALAFVRAVLRRHLPLEQAIEQSREFTTLTPRDRAFARLLAATVLRRLGQIDAAIRHCLERPLTPKAATVHDLLRLGAAQLLFLRTPPHAAVDSTVALAAGAASPYRALVNAVLRRLSREGDSLLAGQDAARLNTPDWLWESWCGAYGEATARAIADAAADEPPLDLSIKADAAAWAERLGGRLLPTGSVRLARAAPVAELPGYDAGAWWVQDAAAALPARLLGEVGGATVVDLCAAPGGKTAQLTAQGARVMAVDRSAARLARLGANLARLGLTAEIVAADAAEWRPPTPAQFVLLDAPCTATGTLRRHPDVRWLKTRADLERLVPVQDRLLAAATEMLAPGGTLVYCTCSLQPEEGPARIDALLAKGASLKRRPVEASEVGDLTDLVTADGDLRTLPCHLAALGGMDGFYAARLERVR